MESVRTDEQILHAEPVQVRLGGVSYPVRPLSIRESRIWRLSLTNQAAELARRIDSAAETDTARVIETMFLEAPDALYELVFSYARDIPRDVVLDTATDREMLQAFREVMRLAFPFAEEFQTLRALAATGRR